MDNNMNSLELDKEEEEEEEAISLSNFPLNPDELEKKTSLDQNITRRSSSDFFEFFNDLNSDRYMSHAEDIIFGGKLVPYYQQQPHLKFDCISTRYCESLPELNHTRSTNSSTSGSDIGTLITRSCRSLDSSKRNCRSDPHQVMNSKNKRWVKCGDHEGFNLKASKPRWYFFMMFGVVKFPPEMDLRDIKNRQYRRNMFDGERVPTRRRRRRSSWGQDLIRVLSCKSHASVAVVSTTTNGGIVTG